MSKLSPAVRTFLYAIPVTWLLLVFVPSQIEGLEGTTRTLTRSSLHLGGALLIVLGAALGLWAVVTLVRKGGGTPVPFDPPRRLVPGGPYAHTRNPLVLSFLAVILGEAALRESVAVALYGMALFGLLAVIIIWVEEPHLARRHGPTYATYCRHVPRFWPRWRTQQPEAED